MAAAPISEGRIPIIKLYRNLIVVIQGSLTDQMVDHLKDEVPRAIERSDVAGLVISVAGVDVLDSYISRMIYDVALVARLMGVDTIVCGINAFIALTLVEMGMSLAGVPTALNLERAIETLEARRLARMTESSANVLDDSDAEDKAVDENDSPVGRGTGEPDRRPLRRSFE